ncbi:protein containing Translation elongation factor EFG/EF2, partial [marine sediment metagenome]
ALLAFASRLTYLYLRSFGYIGHLRTITSGRGQFSMEFSHYSACPQNVADKVIEEAKARKDAK